MRRAAAGGRKTARRLAEAIGSGDPEGVLAALAAGASASERDEGGSLPLVTAAMMAGAAIRVYSSDPATMEAWRARPRRHDEVIRLLLANGATLEAADRTGATALHMAASTGGVATVALLLSLGAQADARRSAGRDDELDGATPLHHACRMPLRDDLDELVRMLLAAGADPDARTSSGQTPAMLLCRGMAAAETLAALTRLLDAGANPDHRDRSGYTALMTLDDEAGNPFAPPGVELEARRLFAARGASTDGLASLALVRSAGEGDLAGVRSALAVGADPGFVSRRHDTALARAAGEGHQAVVRELLACGADPPAPARIGNARSIAPLRGDHRARRRRRVPSVTSREGRPRSARARCSSTGSLVTPGRPCRR